MKRKITRLSLAELAEKMKCLSREEQRRYIGGESGTELDPFTYQEYLNMCQSGCWTGGYVEGSSVTYTRDDSGHWVKSPLYDAIYIDRDEHLLKDVVVTARRREYDDPSDPYITGIWWGVSEDYWSKVYDVSGVWLGDDASGIWLSGETANTGGGGSSYVAPSEPQDPLPKFKFLSYQISGKGAEDFKNCISKLYSSSNLMKNLIAKFDKSTNFASLEIILSDRLVGDNYGQTLPNKADVGNNGRLPITLEIQRSFVEQVHPVLTAAIILHEMIHADWLRLCFGAEGGKINFGTETSTPAIYEYHKMNPNEKSLNAAHHELIATQYRGEIISALKTMFPNGASLGLPQEDYENALEAASWIGLRDTKVWNDLPWSVRDSLEGLEGLLKYQN